VALIAQTTNFDPKLRPSFDKICSQLKEISNIVFPTNEQPTPSSFVEETAWPSAMFTPRKETEEQAPFSSSYTSRFTPSAKAETKADQHSSSSNISSAEAVHPEGQ